MNMKHALCAFFLLAPSLTGSAAAAEQPSVRVWIDKELGWDATLIGRTAVDDKIRFLQKGKEGEIRLPVSGLLRVDFEIKVNRNEIMDLYLNEKYEKLKRLLADALAPAQEYLDVPSNLWPLQRVYMKTLLWSGDYAALDQYTKRILRLQPVSRERDEATLFRVLGLSGIGKSSEAQALFRDTKLDLETLVDPPLYHFAKAKVAILAGAEDEAQEELATIVSFHAKNFEWMPAALYESASQYMARGQADVAIQIAEEIQVAYPSTSWKERAATLQKKFESEREGGEKLLQHMAR